MVYAPTHLLLPAKKNKLIIFRWECILSMDAVLKQQILAIFQTYFTYLNLSAPAHAHLCTVSWAEQTTALGSWMCLGVHGMTNNGGMIQATTEYVIW